MGEDNCEVLFLFLCPFFCIFQKLINNFVPIYLFIYRQMEEIIQILIFVGAMVIAVIGQNAKGKKKPMTASPQEVLEDMFPDIESEETLADEPKPVMRPTARRTPKKTYTQQKQSDKPSSSSVSKQAQKVRINTREEARRAFIHSEIFNRKY